MTEYLVVMDQVEDGSGYGAFAPDLPGCVATGRTREEAKERIRGVELLGHKGALKFTQNETALSVDLPSEKPSDYAVTLKIEGA
jgi:predicted RNase H-like HicB family nuclease